jgi:hypothetical protein
VTQKQTSHWVKTYRQNINLNQSCGQRVRYSFKSCQSNTTEQQRGEGGIASQCSGGKDANGSPRPLQRSSIESSIGLKATTRWVPPSSIRRDVQTLNQQTIQSLLSEDKQNAIFRRVRGYDT